MMLPTTDRDLHNLARLVWAVVVGKALFDHPALSEQDAFRPYLTEETEQGVQAYAELRRQLDSQDWHELPTELVAFCTSRVQLEVK